MFYYPWEKLLLPQQLAIDQALWRRVTSQGLLPRLVACSMLAKPDGCQAKCIFI